MPAKYSFEFISSYDGRSDYRIYIDGRPDTRITANVRTFELSYVDRSPVLRAECDAFNAMKREMHDKARAKYPETPNAPTYRPRA